jgi:hypothetical protein
MERGLAGNHRHLPMGLDPSLAPMAFMDELATNASANGVRLVWYSGNDDALTTHFSTEVTIQVRLTGMTWAIR